MFPLIAVGAAIAAGALLVGANAAASSSPKASRGQSKGPERDSLPAPMQSYVVTPVPTQSISEQIGKFIV